MGLLIVFASCKKEKAFSDIPFLEYRGFEIFPDADTTANRPLLLHKFYFTDGDGDVGDRESLGNDQCLPENYDILYKYYRKINGQFIEEVPLDTCKNFYSNSFPDLTPTGTNKALEGIITNPFDFVIHTDSVKFEYTLIDRSGNKSNTVVIPAQVIN